MGFHREAAALRERGNAVQRDAEAVVEEGAGQAERGEGDAAAPALEVYAAAGGDQVRAEAEVRGEGLLDAEHRVVVPARVGLAEGRAAEVRVAGAAVQDDAGLLAGGQHREDVETGVAAADDVAVGRVEQVVRVVEAVGGDAVGGEAVAEGCVQGQLGAEGVEHQADGVAALRVEVRVAVGTGGRVGGVDVGVEVADAGAADAQVVAQADVAGRGGAVLEACHRDEVAVVDVEGGRHGGGAIGLPGVLVADAGLRADRSEIAGKLAVGRSDAVVEVVVEARGGVLDVGVAAAEVVRLGGGVVAVEELRAGRDGEKVAERGREVGLGRVADGVLARVGAAVGQVEAGEGGAAEGVAGVVGGRGALVLVGEDEAAGRDVRPEVLVVRAEVDGVAPHPAVGRALVAEGAEAREGHFGGGGAVRGRAEAHQAGGHGDEVQGVDLVAGAQVADADRRAEVRGGADRGRHAAVLDAGHVHLRLAEDVLHRVEIQAEGELALLEAAEEAAAVAAGRGHPGQGAIDAVGDAGAAGRGAVGRDVQHAADALGVVADARIRHDLDVLHGARRHHLEDGRGVLGHHLVRLAVDIDLEAGGAVDRDAVLAVHGDHRDLAEHVEHGRGLRVHVRGDVVGHLVDLHLDERALGGHGAAFQQLGVILGEEGAEVDLGLVRDGEFPADLLAAEVVEEHHAVALDGERVGEFSFGVGRCEGDRLFLVSGFEELDDGVGFSFAGRGVEDGAPDRRLGQRRRSGQHRGQKDQYLFHIRFCLFFEAKVRQRKTPAGRISTNGRFSSTNAGISTGTGSARSPRGRILRGIRRSRHTREGTPSCSGRCSRRSCRFRGGRCGRSSPGSRRASSGRSPRSSGPAS